MKILALDIGTSRIGVAISVASFMAKEYSIIVNKNIQQSILKIKNIIQKEGINILVIGMPKNMDGTESKMSNYVRKFAQILKQQINIKMFFIDERLTSIEAYNNLKKMNLSPEQIKSRIDACSAKIILEQYLNEQN